MEKASWTAEKMLVVAGRFDYHQVTVLDHFKMKTE